MDAWEFGIVLLVRTPGIRGKESRLHKRDLAPNAIPVSVRIRFVRVWLVSSAVADGRDLRE